MERITDLAIVTQFAVPLVIIIGSLAIGFLIEKLVVFELRHLAVRTKWRGDEVLVGSLHGIVMYAILLGGIYVALFYLPLDAQIRTIVNKSLLVAAILLATVVLSRFTSGLIDTYVMGNLPSTSIFTNITKLVIFIVGLLVVLQSLGVSITPMLTALGVGGLAVALAMQETFSNLFAGVQIIASKQVKKGDFIKLETGETGVIDDITWRNTTIKDMPNNTVIIPNSKLATSIITNYYQPEPEMSVLVEVGVSYDSDLEKVERVTLEVAHEVMDELAEGVSEFDPFLRYHTFGESSINFTVIMRVRKFIDQYPIKHEFIKRLHTRFNKESIEIPFPIRTVHLQNSPKIPG